eukprot:GHVN01026741.1.p1 GENE.GHVN01026741.1~~GHVN01026741.1.p1  ORF type:complete len:112 (-),score=2.71 GHVN01026741.1:382-717(-)
MKVNETDYNVVLDGGAEVDCISQSDAQALGIREDTSQGRMKVKGVGKAQTTMSYATTVRYPEGRNTVSTRFRIMQDNIPVLISKPTLKALGTIIDYINDEVHQRARRIRLF